MIPRSNRREVRNPVLGLEAMTGVVALSAECKAALYWLLRDIAAEAEKRSAKCWAQRKGPMALYWHAVKVYAKHIAAAVRRVS